MLTNTSYSYTELSKLKTYGDRLAYLQEAAKGHLSPRSISNPFYASTLWKKVRADVIRRDMGFDIGVFGIDIVGPIFVHHIVPLELDDITQLKPCCLDPDNLVCVSEATHNKIHYAETEAPYVERKPGDTKLW